MLSVRSTVGASSAMQHIEGNYDRKAKLDAAISHSFPAFCSTPTPTRGAVGPSSAAISLRPADCPRIGRFNFQSSTWPGRIPGYSASSALGTSGTTNFPY